MRVGAPPTWTIYSSFYLSSQIETHFLNSVLFILSAVEIKATVYLFSEVGELLSVPAEKNLALAQAE